MINDILKRYLTRTGKHITFKAIEAEIFARCRVLIFCPRFLEFWQEAVCVCLEQPALRKEGEPWQLVTENAPGSVTTMRKSLRINATSASALSLARSSSVAKNCPGSCPAKLW